MKPNDILQQAKEALSKAIAEKKQNQELIRALGPAIVDALEPALKDLAKNAKYNKDELIKALEGVAINLPEIKIPKPDINVNVPDVNVTHEVIIPEIKIPEIKYRPPDIRIPDIKMPDEMNVAGWVGLMGYDKGFLTNPLPVQIRDAQGNPVSLGGGTVMGGGGKADFFTIKGFMQSAFSEIMNPDGNVKVEVVNGPSGGLTDTELRAAHLDVQQLSGSVDSVNVISSVTLDVKQLSGSTDSVSVVTITDIFSTTVASSVVNPDNRVKVELPTGSSGLTDTELRAAHLDVQQLSGSVDSVSVVTVTDIFSTTTTSNVVNPDNRVKVELPDGASGLTDTELRASHLDVQQVSGSIDSVWVQGPIAQGDAATAIRVVIAGNSDSSVFATNPKDNGDAATALRVVIAGNSSSSVFATNPVDNGDAATALRVVIAGNSSSSVFATNPVNQGDAATALRVVIAGNSDSSVTATQAGTWNINAVTSITNSVAAALVNSTGVQYSGSNPVPTYLVAGSGNSTISVGPTVADAADDGSAPLKVGGIARTANPTAVAANDIVSSTYDDLGRQVIRPFQVRDLTLTAYVTITTGVETTLLAASAGNLHDLVYIMAANESSFTQNIDIREATAGNVIMSLSIPANATAGVALPMPYPQSSTGNNWTVDNDGTDVSNTTINVSALFVREI